MKSKANAITAFVISLFSWIPLINLAIAPLGMYFGFKALKEIKEKPDFYEGKRYAFVGLVISAFATIASYTWLILRLFGK